MSDTGKFDDGSEHIGRYINHLSKMVRYASNSFLSENGVNITMEQCRLLAYLSMRTKKGECVFQRDIEKEFGVKRSTVASILANLERNGYIARTVFDIDSRTKIVKLTQKGEGLDRRMLENIGRIENALSAGMTDSEKEEFLYLIKKAIGNLEAYAADEQAKFTDKGE